MSYFTVMYCHSLSVSVAVVLTLVLAIDLAKTIPADWIHGERVLLALFNLFWAGCIITAYFYWYGLPSWSQSPHPVTYVCILLGQEMLSLGLYFSEILTIPVQALSLGHTLTTKPPI
jgi:glycogen synthase